MSRQVASEGARAWQPAKKPIRLQPDDEHIDRSGYPCSSALFCPDLLKQGWTVAPINGCKAFDGQGRICFKRRGFRILISVVLRKKPQRHVVHVHVLPVSRGDALDELLPTCVAPGRQSQCSIEHAPCQIYLEFKLIAPPVRVKNGWSHGFYRHCNA